MRFLKADRAFDQQRCAKAALSHLQHLDLIIFSRPKMPMHGYKASISSNGSEQRRPSAPLQSTHTWQFRLGTLGGPWKCTQCSKKAKNFQAHQGEACPGERPSGPQQEDTPPQEQASKSSARMPPRLTIPGDTSPDANVLFGPVHWGDPSNVSPSAGTTNRSSIELSTRAWGPGHSFLASPSDDGNDGNQTSGYWPEGSIDRPPSVASTNETNETSGQVSPGTRHDNQSVLASLSNDGSGTDQSFWGSPSSAHSPRTGRPRRSAR